MAGSVFGSVAGSHVMTRLMVMGLICGAASGATAGPQAAGVGDAALASDQRLQQRYQIGVLERVLEEAVQHGAQMTSRTMPLISPSMWLFAGPVRARGIMLEGYGLFFDVEVPALRRSLAWSLQTLDQRGLGIARAMESLRTHVASLSDRSARSALEQALQRIEIQVGPPVLTDTPETTGAGTVVDGTGAIQARSDLRDPGEAYTENVRTALVDAMLDHSAPVAVADDEWLTVAARDSQERLGPPNPDDILTLVLRVRGRDLRAFRSGELSREDARARVEARDF